MYSAYKLNKQGDNLQPLRTHFPIRKLSVVLWASLVDQLGKKICLQCRRPPVKFLGWEDPLEKGKAAHFIILAWRIPRRNAHGSQRVGHNWAIFINFTVVLCLVLTVASWPATDFSGGRRVVWYSQIFKNFQQFVVIYAVEVFSVVNKAKVVAFFFF